MICFNVVVPFFKVMLYLSETDVSSMYDVSDIRLNNGFVLTFEPLY